MRLLERRLRLHDVGLRRQLVGRALVDRGLRDVLVVHKLLAALQLQLGVDLRRLCLGEIGLLLVDRSLVGGLLDAEQQVAGLDLLPFGEIALLDEARHPRDDVDLVDCDDTADEIAGFRDLTADHRGYGNRRRRRSCLGAGGAAANEENKHADGGSLAQSAHGLRPRGNSSLH